MTAEIDVAAFVEFEATGYDKVAAAYHRHFGALTARVADPLLDAAGVGPGTRVLDAATGPGQVAERAVARGASVLGFDLSPGVVEHARSLHPTIDFQQGDAHQLWVADASFDAVVANFLIPHLADHARATGELARVLVGGGRVALSTWDVPERCAMPGVLFLAVQEAGAPLVEGMPAGPPFFRYADDTAFADLLAGAGLVDVEVSDLSVAHQVTSADVLWDSLLEGSVRAAAQVLGQTPEMQRRIRQAFDGLVAEYRTDDGLELPASVKIAAGRRPA